MTTPRQLARLRILLLSAVAGGLTGRRRPLAAVLTCAAFLAAAAPAQAELRITPSSLDFGSIAVNATKTLPLRLENTGTSPIEILRTIDMQAGTHYSSSGFQGTIAPGGVVTVLITFEPSYADPHSDRVEIDLTGDEEVSRVITVPVSGTAYDIGQLNVDTREIWLDTVDANSSHTRSYRIRNDGMGSITVQPPTFSDPQFTSPDFTEPRLLGPNSGYTFTVQARAPLPLGDFEVYMWVSSDGGSQRALIFGRALGARLRSDTPTFAATDVGSSRSADITVVNDGNVTADVASVVFEAGATGVGTDDFQATPTSGSIAAGGSTTWSFSFAPSGHGTRSASAQLRDAQGRTLLTVPLSGTGLGAELEVASRLDFSSVAAGRTLTRTLSVKNSGVAPLTFDSVSASGTGFTLVGSPDTSPLAPGSSRTFRVAFAPTGTGPRTGSLEFATNAGTRTVELAGDGSSALPFELGDPVSTEAARPSEVAVGDVDEDGTADLVIGFAGTGAVEVAPGRGDGTFAARTTVDASGTSGSMGLTVGDVDEDGHLDLVASGPSNTRVFQGRGDGTFTRSVVAVTASDHVLADFNEDGHLDLVGFTAGATAVQVWLGAGNGTFAAADSASVGRNLTGLEVGDLDRDGDADLITSWVSGSTPGITVLRNTNPATVTLMSFAPQTLLTNPAGLAIGQFDADLRPDVTTGRALLKGITDVFNAPVAAGRPGEAVAVLDVDGDGRDDQVTTSHTEDPVNVSFGDGALGFSSTIALGTGSSGGTEAADLAVGDVNGDGHPDVLTAKGGQQIDVLLAVAETPQSGAGKALISEVRFGADAYVQIVNRSRTKTLRMDGWQLRFNDGRRLTFPSGTRVQPGGSTLATGPVRGAATTWSLASVARGVTGVPAAATGVALIDLRGTTVDAVGLTDAPAALRESSGLSAVTFAGQGAYVRKASAGAFVDTGANAADFQAVDTAAQNGQGTILGAPRPDRFDAPTMRNDILQSSLLEPGVAQSAAPNRERIDDTLVIRRTLTNCSGGLQTGACVNADPNAPAVNVTRIRLRITDLSTVGATTGAQLKILDSPGSEYSTGLNLDAPTPSTGGGINSTLTPVILPFGGLAPGASMAIEFTMKIERGGSFRFGYDAEDDVVELPRTTAPPAAEAKVPDAAPVAEAVSGTIPAAAATPTSTSTQTPLAQLGTLTCKAKHAKHGRAVTLSCAGQQAPGATTTVKAAVLAKAKPKGTKPRRTLASGTATVQGKTVTITLRPKRRLRGRYPVTLMVTASGKTKAHSLTIAF